MRDNGVMLVLLAILLTLVPAGGVFGEASASATVHSEGQISLDLTVEAPGGTVVVAHVIDPGDDQTIVSMGEQSNGVFTGVAIVENANLVVVFEVLAPNGISRLSDPWTLLQLGVDRSVLGYVDPGATVDEPEPPLVSAADERLLWGAAGAGAAALALVAFWAAGPKPQRSGAADEEE